MNPSSAPAVPGAPADGETTAAHGEGTATPMAPEGAFLHFFNPHAVPHALLTLVFAYLAARGLRRLSERISENLGAHRLVIKQGATFVTFGVWGLAVAICVSLLFDFSSQTLFALSGGAAVTVGFALKDVAASFLASITVLATKPFQVGDRVSFGGFYGEVVDIGLRSVRLVTLDDNLVTIPSHKFLTEAVSSANAGALDCMINIPFYVHSQADHARAKDIVTDAVLASRYLYLGKPFVTLVSHEIANSGVSYVQLLARAYVYDARHEKAFLTDVTEQVLTCFQQEGIALAGPNQAVAV